LIGQRLITIDERFVTEVIDRTIFATMTVTLSGAPRCESPLDVLGRGLTTGSAAISFSSALDETVQSIATEDEDRSL
jgi:hypothetical protein